MLWDKLRRKSWNKSETKPWGKPGGMPVGSKDKDYDRVYEKNYSDFVEANGGYEYNWNKDRQWPRRSINQGWGRPPVRKRPGSSTATRVVAVLAILIMVVAARNVQHPLGDDMRSGLRYVLTAQWNFQPAFEKAVQLGLQLAGVENNFDSGIPREQQYQETMAPQSQGFLIPVSGKVARPFGWSRDSLDNLERFHPGIDVSASPGSPVKAVLDGKVLKVGEDKALGKYIQLDHGQGTFTLYAGLEDIKLAGGQEVKAGELLGTVAKLGEVTGGGLHFELRENNSLVDPLARIEFPQDR